MSAVPGKHTVASCAREKAEEFIADAAADGYGPITREDVRTLRATTRVVWRQLSWHERRIARRVVRILSREVSR